VKKFKFEIHSFSHGIFDDKDTSSCHRLYKEIYYCYRSDRGGTGTLLLLIGVRVRVALLAHHVLHIWVLREILSTKYSDISDTSRVRGEYSARHLHVHDLRIVHHLLHEHVHRGGIVHHLHHLRAVHHLLNGGIIQHAREPCTAALADVLCKVLEGVLKARVVEHGTEVWHATSGISTWHSSHIWHTTHIWHCGHTAHTTHAAHTAHTAHIRHGTGILLREVLVVAEVTS
jgi:hypothetical protein